MGNTENTAKQCQMPPEGLFGNPDDTVKYGVSHELGGCEIAKRIAEFPQNLQTVIDGWPFLTKKEQQRITQFVKAHSLAPVK